MRIERASGATIDEMRANLSPELYQAGDCVLVWVNEGDLCIAAIEALTRPAPDPVALVKAGLEAAAKVAETAAKEWTRTTTSLEVKASPVFSASIQAAEIIERNIRNIDPAAVVQP